MPLIIMPPAPPPRLTNKYFYIFYTPKTYMLRYHLPTHAMQPARLCHTGPSPPTKALITYHILAYEHYLKQMYAAKSQRIIIT